MDTNHITCLNTHMQLATIKKDVNKNAAPLFRMSYTDPEYVIILYYVTEMFYPVSRHFFVTLSDSL